MERMSRVDAKPKTLEQRINETTKMRNLYPDRIPILVKKYANAKAANIDRNKFMVPKDLNFFQFTYVIRRRLNLKSGEALFLFNDHHRMISGELTVQQAYNSMANEDGFLYIWYDLENAFGSHRGSCGV